MVVILLMDLQDRNKVSLSAENMAKIVSFKALVSVTPMKWPIILKTATDRTVHLTHTHTHTHIHTHTSHTHTHTHTQNSNELTYGHRSERF